mmetsp:Transcript_65591/g.145727  ORF Transcript_65591/g.145727 Transcript_65591/m.145727 type:complete len:87 (+) Transcript_65591:373-633(+)
MVEEGAMTAPDPISDMADAEMAAADAVRRIGEMPSTRSITTRGMPAQGDMTLQLGARAGRLLMIATPGEEAAIDAPLRIATMLPLW